MPTAVGDGAPLKESDLPVVLVLEQAKGRAVAPRVRPTSERARMFLRAISDEFAPYVSDVVVRKPPDVRAPGARLIAMHNKRAVATLNYADHDGKLDAAFAGIIEGWLRTLFPKAPAESAYAGLTAAIEVFYSTWTAFATDAALAPEDKRTGDALAEMANEVAKSDDPPRGVLRETFAWFAKKADLFVDEFAKGAGKTTGTAFGIGLGATASGQLPHLVKAIEAVHALLS